MRPENGIDYSDPSFKKKKEQSNAFVFEIFPCYV